jgi:hypothetical protein
MWTILPLRGDGRCFALAALPLAGYQRDWQRYESLNNAGKFLRFVRGGRAVNAAQVGPPFISVPWVVQEVSI